MASSFYIELWLEHSEVGTGKWDGVASSGFCDISLPFSTVWDVAE